MTLLKRSLLLIILAFVSCTSTKQDTEKELPAELIDRIELTDLEGGAISLDDFKGKTVFLNYWATWCRPCIAEMPDIDEAAKILGEEDFVFIAASDESVDKIKKYITTIDYSFQFVKLNSSVFDLEIMALPTTMIINKKGEIVYNEVGARKWDSETEINKLREIASQ